MQMKLAEEDISMQQKLLHSTMGLICFHFVVTIHQECYYFASLEIEYLFEMQLQRLKSSKGSQNSSNQRSIQGVIDNF